MSPSVMRSLVLGWALAGPCVDVCWAALPEPTLKRTIALTGVDGRIDHLAYDPDHKRLFVAALGNGSLEVIDLEKGERVKSVAGLKEPQGVVYVHATGRVVVSCGGDGSLHAFDAATLEEKQKIEAGEDADNVRLSADGKAIVVGYGSGAIGVFDATTLAKQGEVKLSGHPESFQLEPGTDRVFVNVPGGFVGGGGAVVVGSLKDQKGTATWELKEAGRNFPMALDEKHHRLYVGCRRPAKLVVMDTETGKVVASPECTGDVDDIFVDDQTGRVYVIGGDGPVEVFETRDQATYTKAASVKAGSGARTGLLVADRRALFVAVPKRSGQGAEIREYALPD